MEKFKSGMVFNSSNVEWSLNTHGIKCNEVVISRSNFKAYFNNTLVGEGKFITGELYFVPVYSVNHIAIEIEKTGIINS